MAKKKPHAHPTLDVLIDHLNSLLDHPEALADYLARLSHCPGCQALVESLERILQRLGHDAPLVAYELYHREGTFHDLMALDPAARRIVIETPDDGFAFRSWGTVDLLLTEAHQAQSPEEARELAELAIFIAHRLETDVYLAVYNANLLAWAHATMAVVELRTHRLDQARIQIDLARATAQLGTGEAHAKINPVEAQLFRTEGRMAEAEALQARAEGEPDGETLSNVRQRLIERLTRYATHYARAA